jgi:hypothetical protein
MEILNGDGWLSSEIGGLVVGRWAAKLRVMGIGWEGAYTNYEWVAKRGRVKGV